MPLAEGISGPHVSAAFLCEKVLNEKDNVPSFIRVAERYTVFFVPEGTPLPPGFQPPPKAIQFMLVVMIKSGDLGIGRFNMRIALLRPNGEEIQSQVFPVFFNGGEDNGVAIVAPMGLPNPDEGLHWFEVYFEESRLTRIPLRVMYQPLPLMPGQF